MKHLVVFALLLSVCFGQATSDPQSERQKVLPSYTLSQLSITGSKLFSEADIAQASGLKIGMRVNADNLKEAGDRLNRSGVFTQVSYRFDGRVASYVVADSDQWVPAQFENFVWFSDADLIQRVHESVPLFGGRVPRTGTLAEDVQAALDSILKQRSIPGHCVRSPIPAAGPVSAMQFRIEGNDIKVAGIEFPGAAVERLPLLQAATKGIVGSNYFQSSTPGEIKQRAQAVYGKLGFLKVRFDAPKLVVVKDDPTARSITLEQPVEEGDQYTVTSTDWVGNRSISSTELAKLVDFKPGEVADSTQLARVISSAKELYGTKGYMYAQVKSTATLDKEQHVAAFHLAVDEGSLYRMGKLELQNLDPQQTEAVRRVWEMREGNVYDSNYAKFFLKKHPRELPLLIGWAAVFTQTIHDDTQIVDLSLKFQKLEQAER